MIARINRNPFALVAVYGAGLYLAMAALKAVSAWSW